MSKKEILGMVFVFTLLAFSGFGYAQQHITADEVHKMQTEKIKEIIIIDVRDPSQYKHKRIPGAINVPYQRIKKLNLPKDTLLILYCSGKGCPLGIVAAEILLKHGYENVFILEGNIEAWEKKRYPLVGNFDKPKFTIAKISSKRLLLKLGDRKIVILDVRPLLEFKAGHLPGAKNMPLENLAEYLIQLPNNKDIVVYDRFPKRSQKAVRQLAEIGFRVFELSGGITVWAARGYPLQVGANGK